MYTSLPAMWLLFLQEIWKCNETFAELYSLFTWRTRNFITRRCYKSTFVAAPSVTCTSFGDIPCYAMLDALQNWQIIGHFSFSWALLIQAFHFLDAYCRCQEASVGAFRFGIALHAGKSRLWFPVTQPFRPHFGLVVDSASKSNGYQGYFVGVNTAGA